MLRIILVWLFAAALALSQAPTAKKPAATPPAKAAATPTPAPGKSAPAPPAKAAPTAPGKAAPAAAGQGTPAAAGKTAAALPVKVTPGAAPPPAGPASTAAQDAVQSVPVKAAGPAPRQRQQKVFDIKYADVNALTGILNDLRRGSSPDRVIPQAALHAIAIETYSAAFLQSAEEIIRRYDVPPMDVGQNHDFEIVAHILVAGRNPVTGAPLPADLESVANELKTTFGFTDIKLVDSALSRAREGRNAFVKGSVTGLAEGATQPSNYEMLHTVIRYEPGAKKGAIEIYGFQFKMKLAYVDTAATVSVTQWQDVAFQTDLNIPEGQSIIVGKSKVGIDDKSLVLVVKARTVE